MIRHNGTASRAPGVHLFPRMAEGDTPAGITISKHDTLPAGDFQLDEWIWPDLALWFVAADDFTADERQAVYRAIRAKGGDA